MNNRPNISWTGMGLLALLSACSSSNQSETRPIGQNVLDSATLRHAALGRVDFVTHVKPILEAKCAVCHNQDAMPGRMSLGSLPEARRTGTLHSFIVPGQPESSPLLTRISSAHTELKSMPPVGERLTNEETALLKRWITQGAPWPPGSAGTLKTNAP